MDDSCSALMLLRVRRGEKFSGVVAAPRLLGLLLVMGGSESLGSSSLPPLPRRRSQASGRPKVRTGDTRAMKANSPAFQSVARSWGRGPEHLCAPCNGHTPPTAPKKLSSKGAPPPPPKQNARSPEARARRQSSPGPVPLAPGRQSSAPGTQGRAPRAPAPPRRRPWPRPGPPSGTARQATGRLRETRRQLVSFLWGGGDRSCRSGSIHSQGEEPVQCTADEGCRSTMEEIFDARPPGRAA